MTNDKCFKENQISRITILGSGVWGSALGAIAKKKGHEVRFYSRRSQESLASVIKDTPVILSAVSMKGVRPTIEKLQALQIPQEVILVTATKGLDPATNLTPSQLWQQAFPNKPVVVLSGPNLSQEIQQQLPAATTVASHNLTAAETIQEMLASDVFRVYVNDDPLGTELGGILKNIMAIAVSTKISKSEINQLDKHDGEKTNSRRSVCWSRRI